MNTNELRHYGVLGMKWGVRRTPDQLARAAKKRGDWSDEAKDLKEIRSKKIKSLSNAELKRANERLNLEKNYRDLTPQSVRTGMSYLTGTATLAAGVLAIYKNYGALVKIGKKVIGR